MCDEYVVCAMCMNDMWVNEQDLSRLRWNDSELMMARKGLYYRGMKACPR